MNKRVDLLVVIILILLAFISWIYFELYPLIGLIALTIPSSFYLIVREKKNYRKLIWSLFIFGGLFGFVFDFIATVYKAWVVEKLVFSYKILGILPIDDIFGFVVMTLLIITFYEHFVDDERHQEISKNVAPLVFVTAILTVTVVGSFILNFWISLPYAYFILGCIAIILPIIISVKHFGLFTKFLYVGIFFFFVWLLAEIAAVQTGGWYFPGQYIGNITLIGLTFPFEELFFWMLFYAASVVSYYEMFIDDNE